MTHGPETIGAVILAAGMSRRMGSPKALLDLGGKPLIGRLVETIQQTRTIHRTIIVTGHQPQNIEQACKGSSSITFVHNPSHEAGGMLSSVQTGAAAMKEMCEAFFVMLLDQPLAHISTLEAMIERWRQDRPMIVRPRHARTRGHPILLSSRAIEPLVALPAEASLRDFVAAQPANQTCFVDVDDPGVLTDVDTPEDYQSILMLWRKEWAGKA